jgi:[acyl-carrier-protein] S-malonyltransferase
MSRAFVFPGQGSQAVGMGQELAAHSAAAQEVFEQVDDALGEKLTTLMFEGPEDQLILTENAQPALMAMSMAVLRALESEGGFSLREKCAYVAGHSLGEYSALCAAGALDVGDTARLLRKRGQAMQQAVPVGKGAMAALLGLDFETAKGVAEDAGAGEVCATANDNAPGQVVVSGDKAAVERAVDLAKERGARRPMLLPVSAPFHCPLMQPAADVMAEALAGVDIGRPSVPLVANVTALPTSEPNDIRDLLVQQVTAMVRWREGILRMKELGVDQLVELGAGKVLATMTKRIDKEITATSISGPADIEAFLASL